MSRRLLSAVLLTGACLTPTGHWSGRGGTGSVGRSVVLEFCERYGSRATDRMVSLFTDSAVVEVKGMNLLIQGRQAIRDLAEYAFEVKSRLRVRDLDDAGENVSAELVETNEWLTTIGIQEVRYRATFGVRLGRIQKAVLELDSESRAALVQKMEVLLLPLLNEEPATVRRLLPGGKLILNRATGMELKRTLRRKMGGD